MTAAARNGPYSMLQEDGPNSATAGGAQSAWATEAWRSLGTAAGVKRTWGDGGAACGALPTRTVCCPSVALPLLLKCT